MPFTPPSNIANAVLYWDSDTSQIRTSNNGLGFIGSLGDSVADSAVVDSDQFLFFDWSTQRTKKVTKGELGIASTEFGEIGTYAAVIDYASGEVAGTTVAGSTLRPGTIYKSGNIEATFTSTLGIGSSEAALTGTWRRMSSANNGATIYTYYFLAVRIA